MSAAINTGGPAFPVDFDHHTFAPRNVEEAKRLMSGMTLRDYFAAKAMQGLMADPNTTLDEDKIAAVCYRIADGMLAARQGGAA